MTLTRHGWRIPGSMTGAGELSAMKINCGGPEFCNVCKDDTREYQNVTGVSPTDDIQSLAKTGVVSEKEASAMLQKARGLVHNYIMSRLEVTDPMPEYVVYVVWFCKTLQNWKALVSTTLPDGMYYEVTYDGDKQRTYVDAYKKFDNVCVPD